MNILQMRHSVKSDTPSQVTMLNSGSLWYIQQTIRPQTDAQLDLETGVRAALEMCYANVPSRKNLLGWPKSSFGVFCNILQKTPNELFGQPNIYQPRGVCSHVQMEAPHFGGKPPASPLVEYGHQYEGLAISAQCLATRGPSLHQSCPWTRNATCGSSSSIPPFTVSDYTVTQTFW